MTAKDAFPVRRRLAAAAIGVAVLLVYFNSLTTPFLFDDAGAVVNNPTIRNLFSLEVLRPPPDGSTTTGRPVVNLSFALNHAISGESVSGYHLTNVLLHAGAALLLFGLGRRTLVARGYAATRALGGAFVSALLWAIHPLQTESVVCIAQRTEVLGGFFSLLTLYGFVRGVAPPYETSGVRRAWLAASMLACLLGMATKETVAVVPVLVLLYDRTFFAGSFASALRQRGAYYGGLAATWLLLASLLLSGGGSRGVAAGFGLGVTPWTYLLKQAEAIVLYLKLAVWPYPLVLDYGTAVVTSPIDVLGSGLLVLGLLAATLWLLVRRPVAGFFGAAFFLLLAPSSSVVPLVTQTVAEHRMYLPLALIVVPFVVAGTVGRLVAKPLGLAVGVASVCAVLTVARNHDYRSAISLWSDTVTHAPDNARAHHHLALALQADRQSEPAARHFARALELKPDYAMASYNWAVALIEQERLNEAAEKLAAAARLAPALERETRFAEARFQVGRLAERIGRPEEAAAQYRETLRIAPDYAAAHMRLGLMQAKAGRLDPAAEHFRAVIRLRPLDADGHANLGNVLLLSGRPREALASYEEALRLRPDDPRTRENIAVAREALR